jgi:exodeoxyribonuclease VII small subunit
MDDTSKRERSFETILAGLEELVSKMEGGQVPLAEALDAYESGMSLVKEGSKLLEAAQARIEKLKHEDDETAIEPLTLD